MEIYSVRTLFTDLSTISSLHIGSPDLSPECWIIEDRDRGLTQDMSLEEIFIIKVYGTTAIPYGRYRVVITKSPRFSQKKGYDVFTPQLLNVKGFDGIRIHIANWASQLEGCLAPGLAKAPDKVINSGKAYIKVLDKISLAIRSGEDVFINITKA